MNATRTAMAMIAPMIARNTTTAASPQKHRKSPSGRSFQAVQNARVFGIVISKYFPSQGKCFHGKGCPQMGRPSSGAAAHYGFERVNSSYTPLSVVRNRIMSAILEDLQPSSL